AVLVQCAHNRLNIVDGDGSREQRVQFHAALAELLHGDVPIVVGVEAAEQAGQLRTVRQTIPMSKNQPSVSELYEHCTDFGRRNSRSAATPSPANRLPGCLSCPAWSTSREQYPGTETTSASGQRHSHPMAFPNI